MKRLLEWLFDLLEYWRIRRIERRAGVRFWQAGGACSGDKKAGDIAVAKQTVSPSLRRRKA
jgi:hypothetical protein